MKSLIKRKSGPIQLQIISVGLKEPRGAFQQDSMLLQSGQRNKERIIINLKYTEYEVFETVAKEIGFKVTKSNKVESDILWFDLSINSNILAKMKNYQRVNHFPGTGQMANKSNLAKNLMKMFKLHPNSYSFFPMTWLLPSDLHELK